MRRALRDLSVSAGGKSFVVPKGDNVMVSPTVGMRIPESFTDPNRFDPDRFGPGREEDKKSMYTYTGFGGGMHSCMGQNFAFLQVKTILSILFREYEIQRISEKMPEPDFQNMVVGPSG